jgi:hypothetical protein
MTERLTLQQLGSSAAVEDLVGLRPDPRWGRACLYTRRYDGLSIADWFARHSPAQRVNMVRSALLDQAPWAPLLRVSIPKTHEPGVVRAVEMSIVVDHARHRLLRRALAPYIEAVLTKVAVAYRRGVQLAQTVKTAHVRMERQPIATVVDISAFFDSISWALVDNVIDGLLVDDGIKHLLCSLVRVRVVERRSGKLVARERGIPQGLSISPLLANLVLAKFDKDCAHGLSGLGGWLRRYCDDMLILLPHGSDGDWAVQLIGERLRRLGFAVKAGTGVTIDTRVDPITWLGIALGRAGLHVPQRTVDAKVAELQGKLTHGVLSQLGLEDTLSGVGNHYGRILAPGMSQELVRSIRARLDLSGVHQSRKVGIDTLRSLVVGPHHVEPPSGSTPWGQPSRGEGLAGPGDLGESDIGAPGRLI